MIRYPFPPRSCDSRCGDVAPKPAQTAIGIDGCPAGWFFVWFEPNGTGSYGVVDNLATLVSEVEEPACLLVDMPIGLPDGPAGRCCDLQARAVLGSPRGRSVFPAPARSALGAKDYCDAKRRNQQSTGKKVSKQIFNIFGKIREIDELVRKDQKARALLRETHPEVCFWSLNGRGAMLAKKKKPSGLEERVAVLEQVRPNARLEVRHILYGSHRFPRKCVGRDDVVDAFVVAVTASVECSTLLTLPAVPDTDAEGLPMRIFYPEPGEVRVRPP